MWLGVSRGPWDKRPALQRHARGLQGRNACDGEGGSGGTKPHRGDGCWGAEAKRLCVASERAVPRCRAPPRPTHPLSPRRGGSGKEEGQQEEDDRPRVLADGHEVVRAHEEVQIQGLGGRVFV